MNYNIVAIDNWHLLFGRFLYTYIYQLNRYQDLIISTHLRLDYRDMDNQIDYDNYPEWVIKNMEGTHLKPKQADYIEESYSRNYLKRLINKYDE